MDQEIFLITIDHLQLMTIQKQFHSEHHKYKEISRRLNDLAKNLNTPLLVLSQVNEEKKMKESRDIYANADNVWLLERGQEDGGSEDAGDDGSAGAAATAPAAAGVEAVTGAPGSPGVSGFLLPPSAARIGTRRSRSCGC